MAVSQTLTIGWSRGSESVTKTITKSSEGGKDIDVDIIANQTDKLVAETIDVSQIKLLWIMADVAMTVETNSGSAPDDTLTLVANEPIVWWDGCGWPCPLGTDVAAFYITNTTAGNLKAHFVLDATP